MKLTNQLYIFSMTLCALCQALVADEPEKIYVPSYDGTYIAAGIRKPPGEGPFPAILIIHGGLGGSAGSIDGMARSTKNPVPDHFFQHGYVIMATDYRRYHFGEDEIQDVMASYRLLASQPFVDRNRIGIIGGSHGGYLAMMLATRIKPAVVVSFAGLGDIDEMFFESGKRMREQLTSYEQWQEKMFENKSARANRATRADEGRPKGIIEPNGSASFEVGLDLAWRIGGDREAYRRISPLYNAEKITSPLLYVVGSEDRLRVAGKKIVDTLNDRGVKAVYSEHEGMGHGFYWGLKDPNNPPQQYFDALKVTSHFIDRYLKKK